jgi:Flp pilus assembly protein TadG
MHRRLIHAFEPLRSLLHNRRGAALIEFAIIAPLFLVLVLAIIETGLAYFSQEALETAAERGLRAIATGAVAKEKMSKGRYTGLVCGYLPTHMSCPRLTVEVTSSGSLGTTRAEPYELVKGEAVVPTNTSFAPGGPGDVVVLRVFYVWPTIGGPLGFQLGNMRSGERLMVATRVARAEPYQL